jgi:hypothetical protein
MKRMSKEELLSCSIPELHKQIVSNHNTKHHALLEEVCLERIRRVPKATNIYTSALPEDIEHSYVFCPGVIL